VGVYRGGACPGAIPGRIFQIIPGFGIQYHPALEDNTNMFITYGTIPKSMCSGSSRLPRMFMLCMMIALVLTLFVPALEASQQLNWSKNVQASDTSSAASLEPAMLVDEHSNKYFFWMDSRDDNWEIYFSAYDRYDARRTGDVRVTDAGDYSAFPAAAMDSAGNMHLVWRDNRDGSHDIYYAKLDRNGTKLVPDRSLTHRPPDNVPRSAGHAPAVAIGGNDRLHIVFSDVVGEGTLKSPFESDLFYCSVDVKGNTLIPPTRITFTPGESLYPDIAVSPDGTVHVVWQDNRDGEHSIFYMSLEDAEPRRVLKISNEQSDATHPAVALDSHGRACIVWGSSDKRSERSSDGTSPGTGGMGIFLSVLRGDGSRLTDSRRVSGDAAEPGSPDIAVGEDDVLHIAWEDGRNADDDAQEAMEVLIQMIFGNLSRLIDWDELAQPLQAFLPGNYNSEIYYIETAVSGIPRCSEIRLTEDGDGSLSPAVSLDRSRRVHVVWYESDSRGGEVFYRHTYRPAAGGESFFVIRSSSFTLAAGCAALALLIYAALGHSNLKYGLAGMFAPLYSTLGKQDILDNTNRQELYRLVERCPGTTFSELMKETGLKNGALAYHLTTLERFGILKSIRDGKYRRFYPRGYKIEKTNTLRVRIVETVRLHPEISQKDIAAILDASRQTVNYQVKKLASEKVIRVKRVGRETRCLFNGGRPIN